MDQAQQLAALFAATLSPQLAVRKDAETQLAVAQQTPSYAPIALALVASEQAALPVRLAAATNVKNLARSGWVASDDHEQVVPDSDKPQVRTQSLATLWQVATSTASSSALRSQLAELVAQVAEHDFPEEWPELLDELIARLADPDPKVLLSVLNTAHTIFRKWRAAFRSDALWSEINLVLNKFNQPFLALLGETDKLLTDASTPADQIPILSNVLSLEISIFHDLSSQDLPPAFEDNLTTQIVPLLLRWLSFSRPELVGDPDDSSDEAGPLEKIRAGICEVAELYCQRYLDVFEEHVPSLVEAVWKMLSSTGPGERYDLLVAKAIGLLSTVVRMGNNNSMFSAPDALRQLTQSIILPNAQLREVDEELFEDNPMEYIRRDLDAGTAAATAGGASGAGDTSDTRRTAAVGFTRALLHKFPETMTGIIEGHIAEFLGTYSADPVKNWKHKDTALYLLTGVAIEGATRQGGVNSVNTLVDVVQFFSSNVYSDLEAAPGTVHPILQVDAIKFLYTFRNQLTKPQLLSVLPLLVQHLQSESYVTVSYAAISIERILFMKHPLPAAVAAACAGTSAAAGAAGAATAARPPLFTPEDVQPFAERILMACFQTVLSGSTPEKIAENDYLMKCVMRLILTARTTLTPFAQPILGQLTAILAEVAKNPSNPRFNQFLFESIASLVRFVTVDAGDEVTARLEPLEQTLFPPFTAILENDVAEFVPYVFQVLAQMLEMHPGSAVGLPAQYQTLVPPLLTPTLWEQRGNVPALVRLFQVFLAVGSQSFVSNNQVVNLMGIYQRLITSRALDTHGFDLLLAIFRHVPEYVDHPGPHDDTILTPRSDVLMPLKKPALLLQLQRLQAARTDKFTHAFIAFLGGLACLPAPYPGAVITGYDQVQPGILSQLLEAIVVPALPKLPAYQQRQALTGLARLLRDPVMLTPPLVSAVPALVRALAETSVSAPPLPQGEEEAMNMLDLEEGGFQASFTKLAAAQAPARLTDLASAPLAEVNAPSVQVYVQDALQQLAANAPPEVRAALA